MNTQDSQVIMFIMIESSAQQSGSLWGDQAHQVAVPGIQLLSKIILDYHGWVIKTIGAKVMCAFPSTDYAAEASIKMQEVVTARNESESVKINLSIGFHCGDVIHEHNDLFGDAVNLAARMLDQAKVDQIITTLETLVQMSPHLQENSRMLITLPVKGKAKPIQICELTWGDEEELTLMTDLNELNTPQQSTTVTIKFNDREVEVSEANPSMTLGRHSKNAIKVPDNRSSRIHTKVEFRRGKIFLIDQSTNGTYLVNMKGEQNFIHHDEYLMEGQGVFGLGREVTPEDPLAIHFSVNN